jgi:hypothetical protein
MGRAKGKGRKENKKPFLATVRVCDAEDEGPAVLALMKVSVTLETKVGVMKRKIAAANPTLRADRMNLISAGHVLDDSHDEKTLADFEDISRKSTFGLLSTVHLTVQTPDQSFMLKAIENDLVGNTKNAIERSDSDLPAAKMVLVHNGAVLRNDGRLREVGVTEGSVLACLVRRPEQAQHEARRWWKMARRHCDVCGRQGRISKPTFPRCGACSKRRYCDEDCQRADWEALGHSRRCPGLSWEERHPGRSRRHIPPESESDPEPDPDLDEVPDQFGPW